MNLFATATIYFFIAIVLGAVGLRLLYRLHKQRHRLLRTKGTVIELVPTPITDTKQPIASRTLIRLYPRIEFTDRSGQTHRFTNAFGYSKGGIIKAGDEIPILYNPLKPNDAYIASWAVLWALPIALLLAASVFLLIFIFTHVGP